MTRTTTYPAWEPDYAVPPGETLLETLEELGMTQRELAQRTDLTPQTINLIVKGVDPITPDTANRLELATGVPASIWNNLEKRYREHLSKQEQRSQLVKHYDWIREMRFPVAELRQRGYLSQSRQRELVAEAVFRFLGTTSPEAWENAYASTLTAFRRCETRMDKPGVTASWLRVAELEASKISCEPFSAPRFQKALDSIRPLTTAPVAKFSRQMRRECAASGVALVFVPEFKGGGINGAARWLSPEKAMIALNIRGRFADIFWFTFFHEAAHVLRHGKRQVFIDTGKEASEQEEEANQFAAGFLIPPQDVDKLPHLKSLSQIRDFAGRIGIHPGIVVGRLTHRRLIQHGWFNDLREQLQWTNE